MSKENYLQIETNSIGDNLEAYFRDDYFHLKIEEPWAGCTETGFGHTTSIEIDAEQAEDLRNLLNRFLEKHQ